MHWTKADSPPLNPLLEGIEGRGEGNAIRHIRKLIGFVVVPFKRVAMCYALEGKSLDFVPCISKLTDMLLKEPKLGTSCSCQVTSIYKTFFHINLECWWIRDQVNSGPGQLVNSGPSDFGTKWFRDQVISGPEASEFGTNFWWIRDQNF